MRAIFVLSLTIFLLISISSCLDKKHMRLRQKNLGKKQAAKNFLEQTADNFYGFKFKAFTGIDMPIRLNKNWDVECFALNGKDCAWTKDSAYVLANGASVQPLSCGAMHQSVFGMTGYNDPNHWCSKGKNFFYNQWHCTDETGLDVYIKLDPATNNVQCLAPDGVNCVRNNPAQCKSPTGAIKPLTCGVAHKQATATTNGYSFNTNHWCKSGRNFFLPQNQWVCFGDINSTFNTPVRQNSNGDIECFSADGKNCAWSYGTGSACTSYMQGKTPIPIACGQDHLNRYGINGYDQSNQWCYAVQHYYFTNTQSWY